MPPKRPTSPLDAKTHAEYLRQALSRRRARTGRTQLYDHSLPDAVRFHGILRRQEGAGPSVRVGRPEEFSPFVIHLTHAPSLPTPEEFLDDGFRPVSVNLLMPDRPVLDSDGEAAHDSLALDQADLFGQLADAGPAERPVRAPLPEAIRLPSHAAFLGETFRIEEFAPARPPRDLLEQLDLPEPEKRVGTRFIASARPVPARPTPRPVAPPLSKTPGVAFGMPHGWHRAIGAFALVSLAFVFPLHAMNLVSELREAKADVFASGNAALSAFERGASAALGRDATGASAAFRSAGGHFTEAEASLRRFGAAATLLGGRDLVEAGELLALAGKRLADGFAAMETEIDPTPVSRLALLSTYVSSAVPHLAEASDRIARVDAKALPEDKRAHFLQIKEGLPVLVATLEEFLEFSNMLSTVLGADGTKRYLLIFQNNMEIRPTGGFMGSFAELTVNKGEIIGLSVPGGGTYDLQGSLRDHLAAPGPLRLLKARWEFQDANWFADFPTSARKMLAFYADAGGGTVDGVIAVNATYVAELLHLLGSVEMPDYGRTITGENFVFEAQKIVELEYDREENTPKAFIGDLAPVLLERAIEKTGEDFLSVLDETNRGLAERHVQLYFTEDALQRKTLELGWAGEIKWTQSDYLMVVDTNLGGGKTDGVIEEDVGIDVDIREDGSIVNTVTVTRTHYGIPQALFTGVNNVDYLRLYVPKGSRLLSADGFAIPDASLFKQPEEGWRTDDDVFYSEQSKSVDASTGTEIYEESGKTVFGNWVQTRPGEVSTARFVYQLPFSLDTQGKPDGFLARFKAAIGIPSTQSYSLVLQKQSGVLERRTRVTVRIPEALRAAWSSHETDGALYDNRRDGFFGVVFEKE